MKRLKTAIAAAAGAALTIGGTFAVPGPAAAQLSVFDPTNYAQNILQAARALEQINHQIASLQNEAAMLQNMARKSSGSTSPSSSGSRPPCAGSTT